MSGHYWFTASRQPRSMGRLTRQGRGRLWSALLPYGWLELALECDMILSDEGIHMSPPNQESKMIPGLVTCPRSGLRSSPAARSPFPSHQGTTLAPLASRNTSDFGIPLRCVNENVQLPPSHRSGGIAQQTDDMVGILEDDLEGVGQIKQAWFTNSLLV